MKAARTCCFLFTVAALLVPQAQGQWAVFDASNYATAVKEFRQLEQLYTTATQTRDQIIQAYNLAYQMSRMPQNLARRYQADFAQWRNLSAPNTYDNTADWINALNLGTPTVAAAAYQRAVIQPASYPEGALQAQDSVTQSMIKNQYATAELGQGTLTNTLETLGSIRSASQAFRNRLANLEADTFSTSPSQQTQMAVLGKINTATLLQVHSQQDTNQILAAAVAQQALAEKQRLDEQNRLINQAVYFDENFPAIMQHISGGLQDAIAAISLATRGH